MPGKADNDHANGSEERFLWLKADPGQFGGFEADQPRPGNYRQLACMPVAAPLPPPRQKEPAANQAGQQYTRDPPVAERRTGQRGRIRPQQRPRSGRGWSRWAGTAEAGTPGTASTTAAAPVPGKFIQSGKTSPSATT
jgi:hypothetical protein